MFRFHAWRFVLRTIDPVRFAEVLPENTFRGAFGLILRRLVPEPVYTRIFEPHSNTGPSGLSDLPRPFVFRASAVAGKSFAPGEIFSVDVHMFDLKKPAFPGFAAAMSNLERDGITSSRSRLRLEGAKALNQERAPTLDLIEGSELTPLSLSLEPDASSPPQVTVSFVTPIEVKSASPDPWPAFHALFARVRDRISTLRACYGDGPLDIDFRALGNAARQVRLVDSEFQQIDKARRSTRTGQRHSLGGVVGCATYAGELGLFLPWLRAAYWTGVGRQTVWGKGVIEIGLPPVLS